MLLSESLEGGVDGGDGEEDTSTRTDSAHEVSSDGESTNAETTEGSGGGDVARKELESGLLAVTLDDHVLLGELASNVLGGGAGDVDPGLGEESAGTENEGDVDERVQGISTNLAEGGRCGDVVGDTTDGNGLSLVVGVLLPGAENADDWVGEVLVQQLREEEQVRHECCLQDNRDIGSVEQFDGVGSVRATSALVRDGNVHAEALEVNHGAEDQHGGHQVRHIRQILSVECLLQRARLILTRNQ